MGDTVILHGRFHPNGRIVLNWQGMRPLENGISPRPLRCLLLQRRKIHHHLRVHALENADWKENNIIRHHGFLYVFNPLKIGNEKKLEIFNDLFATYFLKSTRLFHGSSPWSTCFHVMEFCALRISTEVVCYKVVVDGAVCRCVVRRHCHCRRF